MAAYVILDIEVVDPALYEAYKKSSTEVAAMYGGKFIVRGGKAEALEGDRQPHRVVVLEFANAERARAWWASEEYREPKAIRQRAARTSMILVEGA
jgi:uncharacterized protein (DUF1330 family)